MPTTDILFLAWERPAFTLQSFTALCDNRPDDIDHVFVYTDGDQLPFDPTNDDVFGPIARKVNVDTSKYGGPVACMNDYIIERRGRDWPAKYFLKVDNDLVLPPGAVRQILSIAEEHPDVDLLGIEPWCPELAAQMNPELAGECHGVAYHRHIGGIGLMRYDAFACQHCKGAGCECVNFPIIYSGGLDLPKPARDGRFGFTEWQWKRNDLSKAFINPPLRCFLLDHLPLQPWLGYSEGYVRDGVQRQPWPTYPPSMSKLWDWWLDGGPLLP